MHKFWYHSPLRFYKTKEELSDMTNPQNCQFFGAKNPYPLEKGELHRFLIPKVDNETIGSSNFAGRNLIINSINDDTIDLYGVTATRENVINNQLPSKQYFKFANVVRTVGNYVFYIPTNNNPDKFSQSLVGKKIQISFYIRSNNSQKLVFEKDINQYFMIDSDWKKVSFNIVFNGGNLHFFLEGSSLTSFDISSVKIEFGDVATDWQPSILDEVYVPNLKLFLVGDTEQEIQSLMTVIDGRLCAVTFKCDDFVQGHFEIRNYSEPVFYSNCVKFIDSTDSEGRKFIRIATKHNYDKNLFPYSKSHNLYCVTNLPAYDLGRFTAEVDAKNNRVGNSASLISSESYTDEVVHYEFKAYGDANILSFIQVHAVNNEFYINGTQRTAIDKMEADEFAMIGKLKFTNVKNNLGLNKTINEEDIFSDLQMQIIEKIPPDNFIEQASFFDGDIACKFNSDVYSTGDLTKKMRLFQNGVEVLAYNFNQLPISGNYISFASIEGVDDYVVKIDEGMFKNSFGNVFQGITNNTDWNFTLVAEITPEISISWEDGTNTDLSGNLNNITLKIKDETYSVSNPIISYSWESSTDGISYTQFSVGNSNKSVSLNSGNNFYRVKATLQDNSVIYSNVLKYTKETISTTDYYYKARHPYDYPGYDYVRYIDQYGIEQTEILIRSHWVDLNNDGMQQINEWIEAPCMLIQANQILEVVGATTCTP